MTMHGTSEFFVMGGYGLYVWGAYGVTALVVAAEAVQVRNRRRLAWRAAVAQPNRSPSS